MAVISDRARVAYFIVPKAACTSIKSLFAELDGGVPAPRRGLGDRLLGRPAPKPPSIHQVPGYVTTAFADVAPVPDGFARITVVRDPLARLHSAWSNKTGVSVFADRGEIDALSSAGVPLDPSFGAFVEHFERYRAFSRPAMVHTRPLAWHLGPDLGIYDAVFRLEALGAFEAYLSDRVGTPVTVPRENRSPTPERPLGFEARHADLARAILAPDYALLGGLYDFDASLNRFLEKHAATA